MISILLAWANQKFAVTPLELYIGPMLVCLYLSKSKPNCSHFAILNFNEVFSSFQAAVYEEKSPNFVIYADLSMIYGDLSKIYDDLCM